VKTLLGIFVAMGALAWFLTFGAAGCAHWPAPDPACQGDPALMPCTCMNPRSPQCPPVPSDATKKPDGGTR
jgi:hypothetical protein